MGLLDCRWQPEHDQGDGRAEQRATRRHDAGSGSSIDRGDSAVDHPPARGDEKADDYDRGGAHVGLDREGRNHEHRHDGHVRARGREGSEDEKQAHGQDDHVGIPLGSEHGGAQHESDRTDHPGADECGGTARPPAD